MMWNFLVEITTEGSDLEGEEFFVQAKNLEKADEINENRLNSWSHYWESLLLLNKATALSFFDFASFTVSLASFIFTPPRMPEPTPATPATAAIPPMINGNGISLPPHSDFIILQASSFSL